MHILLYNLFVLKRWHGLTLFFLLIGLSNLIITGVGFYIAPVLTTSLSIPLPLLLGFNLIWGLIFVILAVFCWIRQGSCPAFKISLAYQSLLWILHLTGYRSPYARGLWKRDLLLSACFLGLVFVLSHPQRHTQKSEN